MTDFSYLDRNAEAAFAAYEKCMERGKFYEDREDTKQALSNFTDALQAYAKVASTREEATKVKMPITMSDNAENTALIYFYTLMQIFSILLKITNLYSDSIEKTFLEEKMLLISKEMGEYESYFDGEQLETYETIQNIVEKKKSRIAREQDAIEALKKRPLKELEDQTFAKIRVALAKISSTQVCPVTLDSTGGCFIATAAYMTPSHPDLNTFRDFRDRQLLTNPLGKFLVSIYYQVSPSIASYIEKKPKLRQFIREKLAILAQWLRK
jgi:hypothetical protein